MCVLCVVLRQVRFLLGDAARLRERVAALEKELGVAHGLKVRMGAGGRWGSAEADPHPSWRWCCPMSA